MTTLDTSAAQYTATRNFTKRLAPTKTAPAPSVVNGLVTTVSAGITPPTISVQINGDTSTTIDGVAYDNAYVPVVGDTCMLLRQGTDLVALGRVADGVGGRGLWHTLGTTGNGTFNANWGSGATVGAIGGGSGVIVFRITPDDEVEIKGIAHAIAATPGGILINLPTGFFNAANTEFSSAYSLAGSTGADCILALSATGQLVASPTAAFGTGTTIILDCRFPLHTYS